MLEAGNPVELDAVAAVGGGGLSLLRSLLNVEAGRRATAEQALADTWLKHGSPGDHSSEVCTGGARLCLSSGSSTRPSCEGLQPGRPVQVQESFQNEPKIPSRISFYPPNPNKA